MALRKRRMVIGAGAAALLLAAYAMPGPRADIRILAADKADLDPHVLKAAVDIGVIAISVVITWTGSLSR